MPAGGLLRTAVTGSAAPLLLAGCDGPQSALAPAGPEAWSIHGLTLAMTIGSAAIFLLVIGLMAAALARGRSGRPAPGRIALMIPIGGIALPVVVLTALLVYTVAVAANLTRPTGSDDLRIELTGHMWWWEVRYRHPETGAAIALANEIHIPAGRRVELVVEAADVIHSLWVPSLGGKIDLIPGRANRITLTADRPGTHRGQCAEFCGLQHALMALNVVAMEPAAFDAWLDRQALPAPEPPIPYLAEGRDLFLEAGCGACHVVRGVAETGTLGPDLTHVGGRATLAAGTIPNNVGTLAGWIADAEDIKPGSGMPSFDQFTGEELRALATWLDSLE